MPAWIHDRADHIRRKNPGMPKSESFAIATQQAHATGNTPKDYGTSEGKREAKRKYDEPKSSYVQTADPKTKTAMFLGFADELVKIAAGAAGVADVTKAVKPAAAMARPKVTSMPRPPSPAANVPELRAGSNTIIPPPATAASSFN